MFLQGISHDRLDGWGKRVLSESDARDYCRLHKVYIVDDPKQPYGRIMFHKGYVFILINPNLDRGSWLWVLFHEIGHHALHAPQSGRFSKLIRRKADREANYIAAIALMPRQIVEGRTIEQVHYEFGYPIELVKIRYQIFQSEDL